MLKNLNQRELAILFNSLMPKVYKPIVIYKQDKIAQGILLAYTSDGRAKVLITENGRRQREITKITFDKISQIKWDKYNFLINIDGLAAVYKDNNNSKLYMIVSINDQMCYNMIEISENEENNIIKDVSPKDLKTNYSLIKNDVEIKREIYLTFNSSLDEFI